MVRRFTIVALTTAALLLASPGRGRAGDAIVGSCQNDVELRSAIATSQAEGGGTITFACTATIVVATPFSIPGSITIDGGNKVTLSGGNSSRIFEVGGDGVLFLTGIVLSNGSSAGDGGAISNSGILFVQHTTIQNSLSGGSGGAMVTYGPTYISDSEFSGNKALNGGAIYMRFPGAQVDIQRTSIHDNQATSLTDGWGGAILVWDGASVTIKDSNLSDNTARLGGAVYNSFTNSSVSLQGGTLYHNKATAGDGGGVLVRGPFTARDVTFSYNKSAGQGGGVYSESIGASSIVRSTFFANEATDHGGGLMAKSTSGLTISNSTFFYNFAHFGGGISNSQGNLSLVNVTLSANILVNANGIGSNVYNATSAGVSTLTMQNTILANGDGENCEDAIDTFVSADGNLSDDTSCQGELNKLHDQNGASAKPMLGDFGPHGGTIDTLVPQPGSTAVDGGVSNSLTTDQRLYARPLGSAVDIGAVEVVPCPGGPALCGDANESGGLSASDALLALKAAVGSGTCALWLCDANDSGDLTASDALLILRASVGQPVSPNCPAKWDCVAG